MPDPEHPPKFFVTHSWKDLEFARRLADDLRARGLDGFVDFYAVKPGDKIAERIGRGLEECDVYVPILSFASLASAWCKEEINAAITLSNEPARGGRPRIVPILAEDCQSEMPVFLRSRLYIDFTGRYRQALEELVEQGFGLQRASREDQAAVATTPTLHAKKLAPWLWVTRAFGAAILIGIVLFFALNLPIRISTSTATQVQSSTTQTDATPASSLALPPATPRLSHTKITEENVSRVIELRRVSIAGVHDAAWSRDGKSIVTAEYHAYVYDRDSFLPIKYLQHVGGTVSAVVFSPDGSLIATGADDRIARLWRVSTETLLQELKGQKGTVLALAFSPDGNVLATGGEDTMMRLWQVSDGSLLREIEASNSSVLTIAISPDGELIASGSDTGMIRVWRLRDANLVWQIRDAAEKVSSVAFSPDGTRLATAGTLQGTLHLRRVSDGAIVSELKGHTDLVRRVAFSPDGSILASASDDNTIRLWRVSDGKPLKELTGPTNHVTSVSFSPDGSTLVSTSDDGSLRLWGVP